MRKNTSKLALLFVLSLPAFAQSNFQPGAQLNVFSLPSDPSPCNAAQIWYNTTSSQYKVCPGGVAAPLATGGGSSVSSVFGRTGAVTATSGDYTVSQVTGAAALASPALTGTPTAPTQTTSDNTTAIATDAFVKAQGYLTTAPVTSVFGRTGAVVATSGDYSVGLVTGAAPLASPAFTGTPTSAAFSFNVAQGTSPFSVTSTTAVANLNASLLNGATFAAPGSIGSTTPGSGVFTALTDSALTSGNCVQASTGGLLTTTGSACGTGSGGVTTTGTPASGNMTKFSGASTITNAVSGTDYAAPNANTTGSAGSLSLLTTLGDTLYENSTPANARLAGNTSATKNFLTQTGNGTISAAPAWGTIAAADLPTQLGCPYGGTTGGTATAQTLTVPNIPATLTQGTCVSFTAGFAGTVSTTLAITPTGGTAYAAANLYQKGTSGAVAMNSVSEVSGGMYLAQYDGTEWVLVTSSGTAVVAGSLTSTGLAYGNAGNVVAASSTLKVDATHSFFSVYDNINTSSIGLPVSVGFISCTQATPCATGTAATLYTTPAAAAFYRISASGICTAIVSGATVNVTITYTSVDSAATVVTFSGQTAASCTSASNLDSVNFTQPFRAAASSAIKYAATLSGSPTGYAVNVLLEQLSVN